MGRNTSDGTCNKFRTGSVYRNTAVVRTMVTPRINTKDAPILSCSLSVFSSPYLMEKTAPLPMHKPNKIEVMNVISVYDEPAAANAFGPKKRPTISVSVILYSCCSRLPAIKGREKRMSAPVIEPRVRFICI